MIYFTGCIGRCEKGSLMGVGGEVAVFDLHRDGLCDLSRAAKPLRYGFREAKQRFAGSFFGDGVLS